MSDAFGPLKAALADRYAIECELGTGGMATVYLAHDLKHDRKVAIKLLRPELAASIGVDRFLREIKITAHLNHPHILPLLDSGSVEEQPAAVAPQRRTALLYYVMPYVEGESLRDRLNREKQLPVDDALKIASEVADALGHAHSLGIVHRDVKPENILFTAGHAVVSDFGIARAVTSAGATTLTETGLAVGTPAYMSPEQASGNSDIDARSDLYSLGCVLYEMLSGETPFLGNTPQAIMAKKLTEQAPRVSVVRDRVPAAVEAALYRVLARVPADRFVTARQFVEALSAEGVSAIGPRAAVRGRVARRYALLGAAGAALIAIVVVVMQSALPGPLAQPHPRAAVAVLPFLNLSPEDSNAYFAAGLHDELLTQLAKVAALSVRGRTSVMRYAGTTKSIREVASELAVRTVVEGSVQVSGERLRVNVKLLDAATEDQLWAERYDRTLDDAFDIQSHVAQQIVAAIGAALGETEALAIAAAPTLNPEAYRLYLRANEYRERPGYERRNFEISQGLLEQAVALDSTFALALAALSEIHGLMATYRYDPSQERLRLQLETAGRALQLAPRLPQAHGAMGVAYMLGFGEMRAALEEFRMALEGLPNDVALLRRIGYAHRFLGHWDETLAAFDKAVTLDPLHANTFMNLGGTTLRFLRRYREAEECYRRAAVLAPDAAINDVNVGWTWVLWQGRLDSLQAALDRHPADANLVGVGSTAAYRALSFQWQRKPDSLLILVRSRPHTVFDGQNAYQPVALYAAWAHAQQGDSSSALEALAEAIALLDSTVAVLPDDWRVHASRGMALASLGRRQEALSEARWLEQSRIYRTDLYEGLHPAEERARILVATGETDAALAELERLLAGPSWISVQVLRLDPSFDRIRNDPRFQALLERYWN